MNLFSLLDTYLRCSRRGFKVVWGPTIALRTQCIEVFIPILSEVSAIVTRLMLSIWPLFPCVTLVGIFPWYLLPYWKGVVYSSRRSCLACFAFVINDLEFFLNNFLSGCTLMKKLSLDVLSISPLWFLFADTFV